MICFAWSQFPQYAARCVGAFVDQSSEEVVVVATRPRVPIQGMENFARCRVVWIRDDEARSLREICGSIPRVLFVSGWGMPLFNRFRDEVRANGGKVIAQCDNNFRFGVRELIKAVRFRLLLRGQYDGYMVPGHSGVRLLRFYGVKAAQIVRGMYAADASVFKDGQPLDKRAKRIIFVGSLSLRKNVLRLCEAFQLANRGRSGDDVWTLEICGCGPLKDEMPDDKNIVVHDFVQPEKLAAIYQSARVFCLPSILEHWGLVVHEAALSGCVLLLSRGIGAGEDFLGEHNGFSFNPYKVADLARVIERAMDMSGPELARAHAESLELARRQSLQLFVDGVRTFTES